jgi:hypothetical protein
MFFLGAKHLRNHHLLGFGFLGHRKTLKKTPKLRYLRLFGFDYKNITNTRVEPLFLRLFGHLVFLGLGARPHPIPLPLPPQHKQNPKKNQGGKENLWTTTSIGDGGPSDSLLKLIPT